MALNPPSASIYNGQSISFTCPPIDGALVYEWSYGAQIGSGNGRTKTITGVNETANDVSGIAIQCTVKDDVGTVLEVHSATLTVYTVPATGIVVNPSTISLNYGNQYGYMEGILTTNIAGAQVSCKGVNYASSDNAICTVNVTSGQLNAEGNGTINVWVGADEYPNVAGYCTVIVEGFPPPNYPVTGVSLNKTSTRINIGATDQLIDYISPSNASNKFVTWISANESVATVSSTGIVTGVGIGTINITVRTNDGDFAAICVVTVVDTATHVTGAVVIPETANLYLGDTVQLTFSPIPVDATEQGCWWATTNDAVATIDNYGLVTAVGVGSCEVGGASNDGGYSDFCMVTVSQLPRPDNWEWSYNMISGGNVQSAAISGNLIKAYIMSATEWNNFTQRINDFRDYKGWQPYPFTAANPEQDLSYTFIMQAVTAIDTFGFSLPVVSYGEQVPASIFNTMRDTLNSVL